MRRGNVKILRKLAVRNHILHILGQALTHVVIDLVVCPVVAVQRGRDYKRENYKEEREYPHNSLGKPLHLRKQRPMLGLLQRFIQNKDQRGKHRDAAEHAEQDALCHYNAEIPAHCKGHEAQRDEARNGGDRAA